MVSLSFACPWLTSVLESSCSSPSSQLIRKMQASVPENSRKPATEIISRILQDFDKFQLYFVAAEENKACVADILTLTINVSEASAHPETKACRLGPSFVFGELLRDRCRPTTPFHVVVLEILLEETKQIENGRSITSKMGRHTALLVVDNLRQELEYYEPNGPGDWQRACEPVLWDWLLQSTGMSQVLRSVLGDCRLLEV